MSLLAITPRDMAIGYRPAAGWRGGSGAFLYTEALVDPTAVDDADEGYKIGSRWINTDTDEEFVCLDNGSGVAVWTSTTAGGGGGSIAVKEEGSTIVGSATSLNFIGSAVTVTSGGGGQADITITASGSGNSYFPSGWT